MGFLSRLLMPAIVGDQPQSQPSSQSQPQPAQTQSTQNQIQQTRTNQTPQPQQQQALTTPTPTTRSDLTPLQRNLKQFSLLLFGAGFMAASVAITRRAVLRRQREALPHFFSQSNRPVRQLDGADRSALAAQAFGLATLNVASFGVMMTGGIAWAFDLCSVGELRERTQAALRRPAGEGGLLNAQDEREMEEMMDSLLQRLGMDVSKEDGKGREQQQQQQQQQQPLESTK